MEALNRMVADSLARHGLDRPIDPRRLQWSRWFRCDSTHSLLVVPSKPGIFALAEEIMDLGAGNTLGASKAHVGTAAPSCPAEQGINRSDCTRRMLAVLQFSEDDDMAFTLDRMFTLINPMRARLSSGCCFLRFVVIEDQDQRRSICTALNQWLLSSAEKATGIGADFSSSLELTENGIDGKYSAAAFALPSAGSGTAHVGRTLFSATANSTPQGAQPSPKPVPMNSAPHLDSGAARNLHCPQPFPSGF